MLGEMIHRKRHPVLSEAAWTHPFNLEECLGVDAAVKLLVVLG